MESIKIHLYNCISEQVNVWRMSKAVKCIDVKETNTVRGMDPKETNKISLMDAKGDNKMNGRQGSQ